MILVDSSVWIDHLRNTDAELERLLNTGQILCHPFVIGEIALGHLRQRELKLGMLQDLPQALVADDDEVLHFINRNAIHGLGIGYIDAHLLVSAQLKPGTRLWTKDKRLAAFAAKMRLGVYLH